MTDEAKTTRNLLQMPIGTVVGVAASPREVARLENDLTTLFGRSFAMHPLDPRAPLPITIVSHSDILVIEIQSDDPASLARIDQARAAGDNKPLIAAIANADISTVRALVRRGVSDVVSIPFDSNELFSAVMEVSSSLAIEPGSLAPMWGCIHASGGSGGSTIVSHLAHSMSKNSAQGPYCIVDLDFQYGELASLFGVEAKGTVLDCLEAGDRLDYDIISNAMVDVGDNLFLLQAPHEITPPQDISSDQLLRLLAMLRQHYAHVFLDFPAAWSDATLSAACSCDELILVVEQSVRSMARTKKTIALLESVGVPRDATKLAVNRSRKKLFQAIGDEQVSAALKREVVASIPVVKSSLHELQERGLFLCDEDPRSQFAKSIEALGEHLLAAERECGQ